MPKAHQRGRVKIKEHSFEAQDAFLTDLFAVTLHGPLPADTQKKLFDAAAGMQSRCKKARQAIESQIKKFEMFLDKGTTVGEGHGLRARLDELKLIQSSLR